MPWGGNASWVCCVRRTLESVVRADQKALQSKKADVEKKIQDTKKRMSLAAPDDTKRHEEELKQLEVNYLIGFTFSSTQYLIW